VVEFGRVVHAKTTQRGKHRRQCLERSSDRDYVARGARTADLRA